MPRTLVMTLIGPDRPGLVETVAALVVDHGGNWLESRMARLGGQFAGILRVEVPPESERALAEGMRTLEARGLRIVVQRDEPALTAPKTALYALNIVGQDRPGIVRQISGVLAGQGVNVEDLETECSSAAMSGETLFKARATLGIPPQCETSEIRRKLEKIAEDLIVEISLAELKPRN